MRSCADSTRAEGPGDHPTVARTGQVQESHPTVALKQHIPRVHTRGYLSLEGELFVDLAIGEFH